MKSIKYVVHYDINNNEGRSYTLSATNKVDYIFECLNKLSFEVNIISASLTSKKGYFKGSKTNVSKKIKLIKLPALKWGNIFQKILAFLYSNIAMFLYLVFNVKKGEEIIVYHSLGLMTILKLAKKLKNFKLILEVEEIYNDVICKSEKKRKKEMDFIKSIADKYIFPTEMLNELLNDKNKPYCIIHGTYKVESNRNVSFVDDKIHIVYAGTLDPRKGGAVAATETGKFLNEKYHIHILGFGTEEQIMNIKNIINQINDRKVAKVTYDGVLSGENYIEFLQKCYIGLSTQNPDAGFNNTSFPSKILSYMANGLRVVSVNIPVVYTSLIGQEVYYYNKQEPEEIAKAIMNIDFNDGYDGKEKIKALDRKFIKNLKGLLEVNCAES